MGCRVPQQCTSLFALAGPIYSMNTHFIQDVNRNFFALAFLYRHLTRTGTIRGQKREERSNSNGSLHTSVRIGCAMCEIEALRRDQTKFQGSIDLA